MGTCRLHGNTGSGLLLLAHHVQTTCMQVVCTLSSLMLPDHQMQDFYGCLQITLETPRMALI